MAELAKGDGGSRLGLAYYIRDERRWVGVCSIFYKIEHVTEAVTQPPHQTIKLTVLYIIRYFHHLAFYKANPLSYMVEVIVLLTEH